MTHHPFRFLMLCSMLLCPALLHADWRKDLLKERGIGLDKDSLIKAAEQGRLGNKELESAFTKLSSDRFEVREQGQQTLSGAGESVLDFLDAKEPIEDPEVRVRAGKIRKAVTSGLKTRIAPILRKAAKSLLENPDDPATGGMFYEWFGENKASCLDGFRMFTHEGAQNFKPFVKDGRLIIPGQQVDEEDQRMSLRSKTWPGADQMPDRFQVSCLMGGEKGGVGVWHVALTVGKVKALYHPGYNGGAFRFEQSGTLKKYSENQSMGFRPKMGEFQRMELTVSRLPTGKVALKALVTSSEGESFETQTHLDAEEFGGLDRISLERSGRRGGNALFDDLQVRILP